MENIDEKELLTEEISADAEKPDTVKKKKKFILQTPVIISLGLVVVSLLAFFAYKIFWIAEPEGVLWKYTSDDEEMSWYFEFKEDNVFKAYIGKSFELTTRYVKEKNDDQSSTLTILPEEMQAMIGCFPFGHPVEYTVSGSRLAGAQEMHISYVDDFSNMFGITEEKNYTLTQTKEREPALEPDKDFVEAEELTGEWILKNSSDGSKQTFTFNDDGTMTMEWKYKYSDDLEMEMCYHCTYTVSDQQVMITMNINKTDVAPYDYTIKDGYLYMNDLVFYREDYDYPAATADETK